MCAPALSSLLWSNYGPPSYLRHQPRPLSVPSSTNWVAWQSLWTRQNTPKKNIHFKHFSCSFTLLTSTENFYSTGFTARTVCAAGLCDITVQFGLPRQHEEEVISSVISGALCNWTFVAVCTVIVTQERTVDEKLKELNRAVELFKDRMGLSFKKTSGIVTSSEFWKYLVNV